MPVWISSMKHFVHNNIDYQSSTCSDKHHKWFFDMLASYDSLSSFKDHEKKQHIDDE